MGRSSAARSQDFFRLAFWPLCGVGPGRPAAAADLLTYRSASLGTLASRERTSTHLSAAFARASSSDDGNRRARSMCKGGEQLTECISLGIGLEQSRERPGKPPSAATIRWSGDTHACTACISVVAGEPTAWQPYFRYWHGYRVILAPLTVARFRCGLSKSSTRCWSRAACAALLWVTLRNCVGAAVATIILAHLRLPQRRSVHLAHLDAQHQPRLHPRRHLACSPPPCKRIGLRAATDRPCCGVSAASSTSSISSSIRR